MVESNVISLDAVSSMDYRELLATHLNLVICFSFSVILRMSCSSLASASLSFFSSSSALWKQKKMDIGQFRDMKHSNLAVLKGNLLFMFDFFVVIVHLGAWLIIQFTTEILNKIYYYNYFVFASSTLWQELLFT